MIKKIYSIYLGAVHKLRDPESGGVVGTLRKYISPLFVAMLLLAAILWYITKLGYSYTTEIKLNIHIEDAKLSTTYVAEGVGFKLLGYNFYKGGNLKLPIKELKYKVSTNEDEEKMLDFTQESIFNAITMHFSDIKILSVGSIPSIEMTEKLQEAIKKK